VVLEVYYFLILFIATDSIHYPFQFTAKASFHSGVELENFFAFMLWDWSDLSFLGASWNGSEIQK